MVTPSVILSPGASLHWNPGILGTLAGLGEREPGPGPKLTQTQGLMTIRRRFSQRRESGQFSLECTFLAIMANLCEKLADVVKNESPSILIPSRT